MSAPVAIRQNYSDLFGANMLPVLEELFRAELEMHPSRREQLFKVVSHDRDIWQATELHDLELFENVEEGSEYSFKRPKQGASKTLTIDKFGLGFSVSEEMVEDAKFEVIADMVRKLARSARESQEIQAMNIFNNGFSSETTSDGQPIFDLAHTLPSGLTYRNELATASDLSVTSLDTALSDFETQFIGDSGIIYNIQPKMLVVHPSQKRFAKELIGSDLKVNDVSSDNGATNAMNSFKQDGLIFYTLSLHDALPDRKSVV